jgi:hypothetical protein
MVDTYGGFRREQLLEENCTGPVPGPGDIILTNPQEEISQDGFFTQDTAEERRSHIADHFSIRRIPCPRR